MIEPREKREGKIRPARKWDYPYSSFIKGFYNMMSHNITLMSSEQDTPKTIWHEIMHATLWEDIEIPEEANYDWDKIAGEIGQWLEMPDANVLNWRALKKMKDSIEAKFRVKD